MSIIVLQREATDEYKQHWAVVLKCETWSVPAKSLEIVLKELVLLGDDCSFPAFKVKPVVDGIVLPHKVCKFFVQIEQLKFLAQSNESCLKVVGTLMALKNKYGSLTEEEKMEVTFL